MNQNELVHRVTDVHQPDLATQLRERAKALYLEGCVYDAALMDSAAYTIEAARRHLETAA